MKNRLTMSGGNKWLVHPFRRQEFWKYIGCIKSIVTYGKKWYKLWSEMPKTFGKNPPTKLQRDVYGNTYLNQVCCDLYRPFDCYACH